VAGRNSSRGVVYRGVKEGTPVGVSSLDRGSIDDRTDRRLRSACEAGRNGGKVCPECRGEQLDELGEPCPECDGRGWVE